MRRKSNIRLVLAIAGLLVSAGYVWSQVKARVDLVVVPVNVRDANGQLVTGLTKDDFVVTEDNKPQAISYFSIDPIPLSAAIIIDDGMGGIALKRVVSTMQSMTAGFSPEDEMVAFRYDHFVWKLSEFTNDPAAIQKAFHEIPKIADSRPAQGEPGEPAAAGPEWLRSIAGLVTIGSNGAPNPIPSGSNPPKRPATSRLLHDAIFEAANQLRTRSEDRRKIIFLISDGQVSGANKTSLQKNTDLLLQSGIQVYAISTDFALREGTLGALSSYARATGGDVYGGGSSKDMETAFSRITEQARNQYVLGYQSDNEPRRNGGIFREIKVQTSKPDLKVTHRKGYIQFPVGN
jgi:VWFA-related protein